MSARWMPLEIALRCAAPLACGRAMRTNGIAQFRVCLSLANIGAANQGSQTTKSFVRDEEISHRGCHRTIAISRCRVGAELATNAAKYGALSQPGGHVSVRWTQTADMLRIEWKETGGPPVVAPARQGYGSTVIRDLLTYEIGGRVDLAFESDGVRCTIELPANAGTVV